MMNKKHALLMSVAAAALIAGVGFGVSVASAQAPPSPTTQQNAPAEKPAHDPKGASQNKAPDTGMKSGKADEKMEHKGGQAEHAQDNNKPDVKPMHSETKSPGKTGSETQAEPQKKTDVRAPEKTGDAKVGAKTESKDQGGAGGSVKLSTEQRTTMRAAIKQNNARPMTNVTFSTSIGSRVPDSVHFYRMPEEIVSFYPHWRGYDYFLVGDEIYVVNPRTHEIVAILDA